MSTGKRPPLLGASRAFISKETCALHTGPHHNHHNHHKGHATRAGPQNNRHVHILVRELQQWNHYGFQHCLDENVQELHLWELLSFLHCPDHETCRLTTGISPCPRTAPVESPRASSSKRNSHGLHNGGIDHLLHCNWGIARVRRTVRTMGQASAPRQGNLHTCKPGASTTMYRSNWGTTTVCRTVKTIGIGLCTTTGKSTINDELQLRNIRSFCTAPQTAPAGSYQP